jgi:hypothetical protein
MNEVFLEPTQESGAALFSREIPGAVVMLNMLRLREVADYSEYPELAPDRPISGRDALRTYIDHTLPFLKATGGDIVFLGEGGNYFIGPVDEQWDVIMLIKQNSLPDFLSFASNVEYMGGIGHRAAAIVDSRLLPLLELQSDMSSMEWPVRG